MNYFNYIISFNYKKFLTVIKSVAYTASIFLTNGEFLSISFPHFLHILSPDYANYLPTMLSLWSQVTAIQSKVLYKIWSHSVGSAFYFQYKK